MRRWHNFETYAEWRSRCVRWERIDAVMREVFTAVALVALGWAAGVIFGGGR